MILVDAGPLVALVAADDQHHARCVQAMERIREPLGTLWPVLAEAQYLLTGFPRAQDAIWQMLERRAVRLLPLGEEDVPRIRELMQKYADRPMDLADAALVRVAERDHVRSVFTVDRADFSVYRIRDRERFKLIP